MQVIIEIPYVFIQTTYYTLIVYAMVSFQWKVEKFFWFFFINFFSFLYFTYYGMMTVSITPNHQVAAIFAAAFYSIFNLFSGFFIPRPVSTSILLPTTIYFNLNWIINDTGIYWSTLINKITATIECSELCLNLNYWILI